MARTNQTALRNIWFATTNDRSGAGAFVNCESGEN
jgi:hypothetical protein